MENFLFISGINTEPYFNMAIEEYLLKQKDGYYIYLWQNDSSVIVGINQNTLNEVNLNYTQQNNIKVVRRLTGGGAVYHDKNNVNYTIIAPYNQNENNYIKFTKPVIEYLNLLGVKAEFSGRNDIVVEGKKISGNAQTIYKNRIMHHGTLLFNSDMNILGSALKENKLKIQSKGIKSNRARVTNISNHLSKPMTTLEFLQGLSEYLRKDLCEYFFDREDIEKINKLVKEKYSKYEWNFGSSPKGNITFEHKFNFGIFSMNFSVEKGKMQGVRVYGDFFSKKEVSEFSAKLENKDFTKDSLNKVFEKIDDYIVNANGEEIVQKIFE